MQNPTRTAEPDIDRRIRHGARATLQTAIRRAGNDYRRQVFLRTLHRLSGATIAAETPEAAAAVLREIERALRAERSRAGHWTYDLTRHVALLVAHRAERERAERLEREARKGRRTGGLCGPAGMR